MHKITQMRKVRRRLRALIVMQRCRSQSHRAPLACLQAVSSPKYLSQLIKEVSTFLCYEATTELKLERCDVKTCVGDEAGARIAERVGIVPVLRGGLGMVEAMTEMVSNAQVWHLGIYRDKTSLLPIEYYNKLPKKVTVHTVFVLDPMPISGATAVAAMDILKAWGESLKPTSKLKIKFVCIVASKAAIQFITDAHPDVQVHVGLIDNDENVRARAQASMQASTQASMQASRRASMQVSTQASTQARARKRACKREHANTHASTHASPRAQASTQARVHCTTRARPTRSVMRPAGERAPYRVGAPCILITLAHASLP